MSRDFSCLAAACPSPSPSEPCQPYRAQPRAPCSAHLPPQTQREPRVNISTEPMNKPYFFPFLHSPQFGIHFSPGMQPHQTVSEITAHPPQSGPAASAREMVIYTTRRCPNTSPCSEPCSGCIPQCRPCAGQGSSTTLHSPRMHTAVYTGTDCLVWAALSELLACRHRLHSNSPSS